VTDYRSLPCCNPTDIDTLIARVRALVTEPSTPVTWEADHCNIISDHPRPVMLEAIKRLLGEPQPRTDDPLMLDEIRSMLDRSDHAKSLAMLAWFASRGAPSGRFVDDPDDCRKQNEARDEFEKWWAR
jgi:hypothetical protein